MRLMAFSIFLSLMRPLGRRLMEMAVIFILLACLWGANLESETSAEIRLVNGFNNCSGRVEVFHSGSWGTICDDSWDIKEARVVCQQLGCGEARTAPGGAQFGRGTGEIWLGDVHCNGTELALVECSAEKWGSHNCHHGEDAGVICSGATLESESWDTEPSLGIRLVNGQSNCSGRVEVLHDGQWGTICDDLWDIIDARIVCKEMGCGQARLAPSGYVFGSGTGPIWLDDVQCTGTESSLSQCPASRWETHKCSHSEDVAVICVDNEPHHSPLTLWLPALCVFLATALLVLGGIIWYFTSKWKGSRGDGVQLEARNIIDGDM